MSIKAVNSFILRAARKSDEMLEPYESKGSRTVLRRERASNRSDLADYGHIHHKFTSMMVTENCVRDKLTDHLSYFGKYYKNNQLIQKGIPVTLNNDEIQFKHEIMQNIYVSQNHAYQLFAHMIPYEQLISYDDWYFGI